MQVQIARRYDAVKAAQNALLDRVKNNPEKMMEGILQAPELLRGIRDIEPMLDIFVSKGMYEQLEVLVQAKNLPKYIVPMLVNRLM